jgi:hypothetical protein
VQNYEIFVYSCMFHVSSFLEAYSHLTLGDLYSFSGAISCYPLYLFRQGFYG